MFQTTNQQSMEALKANTQPISLGLRSCVWAQKGKEVYTASDSNCQTKILWAEKRCEVGGHLIMKPNSKGPKKKPLVN